MYNNLILNTDALGILLEDLLIGSIYLVGAILFSALMLHLGCSFFAGFFALVIDPKDLLFFRDTKSWRGETTDWFAVYLGISMWTWICIGIGFIILISVKLLFVYGVLRFR